MNNTGLNQAVIAYKVRASDKAPLDINGDPISKSGRRQAIAILRGYDNPNPASLEVEFIYGFNAVIDGVPTAEYSDNCPVGFITISKDMIVFVDGSPNDNFIVNSSAAWNTTGSPPGPGFIAFTPVSGPRGETVVDVYHVPGVYSQGYFTLTNLQTGQTAKIYIVSVDAIRWILTTGAWDDLGFWMADGIWNY